VVRGAARTGWYLVFAAVAADRRGKPARLAHLLGVGTPVAQTTQAHLKQRNENADVRHIVEIYGRLRVFVV
jgi:hypothetical protein